ncbi:Glycine--tRNA ligase [Chlorella vulgaris]
MQNVLERRMFITPSFKIYGGVAGFFDYGPPGCAVKQNVTQLWRDHFVVEENMLEVECCSVTPEVALRASGHVERFTDFMVRDVKTGESYRADHLLEDALRAAVRDAGQAADTARDLLPRVGDMGTAEIDSALNQFGVKAPGTGNDLTHTWAFNLMFKTQVGTRGAKEAYLRPETAQGIFSNFKELLYYNGSKLPFAAAQVGTSYRNEISPRGSLLRVREFTQAEIEHFCNPNDKRHPKFDSVSNVEPLLYDRATQLAGLPAASVTLGAAVKIGTIANQTLAYYIGRTYLFAQSIGLDVGRVRFRQHLANEMAHYATDCWDFEVQCAHGWVECAGIADRSTYDIDAHATSSKVDMRAYEQFPEPRNVDVLTIVPNKKILGKVFTKHAQAVINALNTMSECDAVEMAGKLRAGLVARLALDDRHVDVHPGFVTIDAGKKLVHGARFAPAVIEPSFGIGRIMYCMFDHCFYTRDDGQRTVFAFRPSVAPVKCAVFSLVNTHALNERAQLVAASLTKTRLVHALDTSGISIGKRYARTDEIGVPFGITIDHTSLQDGTVTLRERDSTAQIRLHMDEVPTVVKALVDGDLSWTQLQAQGVSSG